MNDNVIKQRFKPQTSVEKLLEEAATFELDELILVGVKDGEVMIGNTELESIAAGIGYLEIAKIELLGGYDG